MVNEWLKSYLHNRLQNVSIEDSNSDLLDVLCGVLQGYILGSKLFILYKNDLCNIYTLLKLILFADDTSIFLFGENNNQLSKIINTELRK